MGYSNFANEEYLSGEIIIFQYIATFFRRHLRLPFKDPLLVLREILTMESPLKIMKNAFYFILKASFAVHVFINLFCFFGYVEKWLG